MARASSRTGHVNFIITREQAAKPPYLGLRRNKGISIKGPELWRGKPQWRHWHSAWRGRSYVIGPSRQVWILCTTGCRCHVSRTRLIRRKVCLPLHWMSRREHYPPAPVQIQTCRTLSSLGHPSDLPHFFHSCEGNLHIHFSPRTCDWTPEKR
jgi:hypothetical protein